MKVTFRSRTSPAAFVAGHKFVAGVLVVDAADAAAVRAEAAARPRLGITEDPTIETERHEWTNPPDPLPALTRPKSRGTTRRPSPAPTEPSSPKVEAGPAEPAEATPAPTDVAAGSGASGVTPGASGEEGGDVGPATVATLGESGPEAIIPPAGEASKVATGDGSTP